jgi:DNA-binding transcriptional regulator YhcF (GntR family)
MVPDPEHASTPPSRSPHSVRVLIDRPAERQSMVVDALRSRIIGGGLPPGSRLPARLDLVNEFGVSSVTLQRAIEILKRDGLLRTHGRGGTYVHENPPHLFGYALVFPERRQRGRPLSQFHRAIAFAARRIERGSPRFFRIIHGPAQPGAPGVAADDGATFRQGMFAGVIFASSPRIHDGTPILELPGVPRVGMMEKAWRHISAIDVAWNQLMLKAAALFAQAGRRRLAVIDLAGPDTAPRDMQPVLPTLQRLGLAYSPYRHQGVPVNAPQWTRRCVDLLMRAPRRERPDALLVMDDTLVPEVMRALVEAGLRVPADIFVVAHCNFPLPTYSPVPIRRVGFDAIAILDTALTMLDDLRNGKPAIVAVAQAVTDEEFAAGKG